MGRSLDEGKRSLWRQRLSRYARSSQTVAAFCAAEGVSVPTFYQWTRKLGADRSERDDRAERALGTPASSSAWDGPTFVPVRIEGAAVVEIELPNGARVRVPSGDVGALSAAIAAAGRLSPHAVEEASPC